MFLSAILLCVPVFNFFTFDSSSSQNLCAAEEFPICVLRMENGKKNSRPENPDSDQFHWDRFIASNVIEPCRQLSRFQEIAYLICRMSPVFLPKTSPKWVRPRPWAMRMKIRFPLSRLQEAVEVF
jgi:hypothetical protein